jgi:deoxyribonuclease-4
MVILGAHQSITGGYYRAVERAHEHGCDCVQLFTKNCNQWAARPITADEARQFREALDKLAIRHPIAHDCYLINLASPDRQLWRRSVDAFVTELRRAETLGIPFVVTHPGAYTSGSEAAGLRKIVRALDEVHAKTRDLRARCLLETTAGQGTSLGWRFEELAQIIGGVKEPDRLGVCFDTCHVFAAGYPLGTPKEYEATMADFDRLVGLERIKAFHLNDSRAACGSRVDRHAHIGRGQLGREAFRLLLGDCRFSEVPMYLETPKGEEDGRDWDTVNLQTLRQLLTEHGCPTQQQ